MQFETIDIVAIIFIAIITTLIIISSFYDLIMEQLNRKSKILWTSFSILKNGRKLFASAPQNSDNVIGCLNGIRCISMIWVLFGHSYAMATLIPFINMIDLIKWKSSAFGQVIFNANISVDSFFFLSGFLVAWIGFKELNKSNGKLNIPLLYFHRYVRLTPVIAVIILFLMSLCKYLGDGPIWDLIMSSMNEMCEENWWKTLLYISNYASPDKPCLIHTWYLSVDTQLFILSPILLIPTYKWGYKFLYTTATVICALSIACCFTTHLIYKFPMIRVETPGVRDEFAAMIYYPTHIRLPPWVVGFVFGYFMFQNRSKRFRISKAINLIGWCFSFIVILTIIFGTYNQYQPGNEATPLEATFYESFKRISWSLALSWIVFACQKGYGGLVNSFLSYPFWAIFGRLTYCIYLNHVLVLLINVGMVKNNSHFSDYELQLMSWGHFGITTLISVVTVLAFEYPILEIEKAIFGKNKQKTQTMKLDTKLELENSKKILNNI